MRAELVQLATVAARRAGDAILAHYRRIEVVERKGDGSPLTLADQAAHALIVETLRDSGIPVVSEESDDLRMDARRYWLVDPLDGTKDFLAANGEFTVNIALVGGRCPELGVVFAPALGELYAGGPGLGCWRETTSQGRVNFAPVARSPECRMAVSRFHDHPDVGLFAADNGIRQRVAIGSALKYGGLATAQIDVFPRLVGSSEWDTAAGQALLEGAGGEVLDWDTGQRLAYGKPRRRNPRLLSLRAPYAYADFKLKQYDCAIP